MFFLIIVLQVLQGNYYYNIGDHGGIIVAVKYFKTEGDTNTLMYRYLLGHTKCINRLINQNYLFFLNIFSQH